MDKSWASIYTLSEHLPWFCDDLDFRVDKRLELDLYILFTKENGKFLRERRMYSRFLSNSFNVNWNSYIDSILDLVEELVDEKKISRLARSYVLYKAVLNQRELLQDKIYLYLKLTILQLT